MNIPSFKVFEQIVKGSIQAKEGKVKEVQLVIGITDFDSMFESSIPKDVQGNSIQIYVILPIFYNILCLQV